MKLDVQVLEEFFKLKEQYIEKYKDLGLQEYELIPSDFYHIEDYGVKVQLLNQALQGNKRLEDLEQLQEIHMANVQRLLQDNIDISSDKANKRVKM